MRRRAAGSGATTIVEYLLASEECHVNEAGVLSDWLVVHQRLVDGSGTMGAGWYSPLCMAVEYHHPEIAARLIDAGADINSGDEWFPLYLAGRVG